MPDPFANLATLDEINLTDESVIGDALAEPFDDFPTFEDDAPEVDALAQVADARYHLRRPGKRLLVDYRSNPDALRSLDRLPRDGQSLHSVMSQRHSLWDLVPALIERTGRRVAELHIATLSYSAQTSAELVGLLDDGRIKRVNVLRLARVATRDPDEERNFRRLNLGIWPKTGAGRWLDLNLWDACEAEEDVPKEATLYVGLDLSQNDDLCAAVYVWALPEGRFYIAPEFWLPRSTAKRYVEKDGIPYDKWAEAGHIHLIDESTISPAVRQRIAAAIIARGKAHTVKAVCYDRFKADDAIAAMEAAGLTCVPVPQGYTLSPGCSELDRRLKEGSAAILPNPVLRWCAENTQVEEDRRGNIFPVKPHRKGKYAGTRGLKIDGITALVTAMTEARKHTFPDAKNWSLVCLV